MLVLLLFLLPGHPFVMMRAAMEQKKCQKICEKEESKDMSERMSKDMSERM